jgi:hypothetical protein
MTGLSTISVVTVLMALILVVNGDGKSMAKRDIVFQIVETDDVFQWLCDNYPAIAPYLTVCATTTTASTSTSTKSSATTAPVNPGQQSTSTQSTSATGTTSTIASTTSSLSASALQRAHWCSFSNGTYIPLGYTFMYTACTLCQCTQTRDIRCTILQCMQTYCIDNSTPSPRQGQCCPQCPYEVNSTACSYNGVTIPHGTLIKSTSNQIQCWCQLGNIECRKFGSTVFEGLDLWGTGTAVYVIVLIIVAALILGTLLCCGCTLLYYYYYQRNQQVFEQAAEQYMTNAGWQPMTEDEQVVDPNHKEKQAEAEQYEYENEHPTGNSSDYVPPPYALYNDAYVSTGAEKEQKYM